MFQSAGARSASVSRLFSRAKIVPPASPTRVPPLRCVPKLVPQFVPTGFAQCSLTQQRHLNTKGSELTSQKLETASRTVFIDLLSNFAVGNEISLFSN